MLTKVVVVNQYVECKGAVKMYPKIEICVSRYGGWAIDRPLYRYPISMQTYAQMSQKWCESTSQTKV